MSSIPPHIAITYQPKSVYEPMTPLSPAAHAVWDAWNDAYEAQGPLEDMGQPIAAAILAAADQVVPEVKSPGGCREGERQCVRRELLAIAAELDGGITTPTES